MSTINVNQVIGKSKFNKFFLSVFLFSLFILIFDGYDQGVYGTALPALMKDTGISATTLGLIGSYTLYGMMIGAIFFGMLADKIGSKKVLMIGVAVYSVFTGLFGFANNTITFSIFRILTGMGLAGVVPAAVAMVTEYSPNAQRSALVTITTAGVPIGTMTAALLGINIIPSFGWRPMYQIGFIPLIMVVSIYFFSPESIGKLIKNGDKDKIQKTLSKADPDYNLIPSDEYVSDNPKVKHASFTSLFRNGLAINTILFWVLFSLAMFTVYGMITWLPKLMMTAGYALGSSLQLMIIYTFGGLLGMLISGPIADKIGYKISMMSYTLIPAIIALILITKPSAVITMVLLFLIGAGIYGFMALIYIYVALSYPSANRGTGIGWASGLGRFGGSLGPTIGGILIANKASLAMNFTTFLIVPLALAAILSLLTKDNTKSRIIISETAKTV